MARVVTKQSHEYWQKLSCTCLNYGCLHQPLWLFSNAQIVQRPGSCILHWQVCSGYNVLGTACSAAPSLGTQHVALHCFLKLVCSNSNHISICKLNAQVFLDVKPQMLLSSIRQRAKLALWSDSSMQCLYKQGLLYALQACGRGSSDGRCRQPPAGSSAVCCKGTSGQKASVVCCHPDGCTQQVCQNA